jgi:hypothetical protein
MRTDQDHHPENTESLIAETVSVSFWNLPDEGEFDCTADAEGDCHLPPEADGIGAALSAIHAELESQGAQPTSPLPLRCGPAENSKSLRKRSPFSIVRGPQGQRRPPYDLSNINITVNMVMEPT